MGISADIANTPQYTEARFMYRIKPRYTEANKPFVLSLDKPSGCILCPYDAYPPFHVRAEGGDRCDLCLQPDVNCGRRL